jgi:hypothetical protein
MRTMLLRHGIGRERRHHSPEVIRPFTWLEPRQCGFALAAIDATGASVEGVTKANTLGSARCLARSEPLSVKIQEKHGVDFELTKEKVKKKD